MDNLDIDGIIDSAYIAEADIHAGLYDYAQIEIFMLNYMDISQGELHIKTGWLGEVSYGRNNFVAEVRGLSQKLSQTIGELFSPSCRANLGDKRCKIDIDNFTASGTITNVMDNQSFNSADIT